jgi:hypothetical protein
MMFASGCCWVNVRFAGSTTSELGATPKLHLIIAPMQTCIAIGKTPAASSLPDSL